MSEIASRGQLRLSFLRWALFAVPSVEFLGLVSGLMSGSGAGNDWYAVLAKPGFTPPGWVFGAVWPVLYLLVGLALAVILNARRAPGRGLALMLFAVQLLCNLAWSPLFFGAHQVTLSAYLAIMILVTAAITAVLFWRVRMWAGVLLLPYVVWLAFAAMLSYEVQRLNPGAETLVPPAGHSQIQADR